MKKVVVGYSEYHEQEFEISDEEYEKIKNQESGCLIPLRDRIDTNGSYCEIESVVCADICADTNKYIYEL